MESPHKQAINRQNNLEIKMPSKVSSKGESSFTPLPAGTHIATCCTVVNLGIQPGGQWAPKNKHYLGFEVPGVRVEWDKDGKKMEGPSHIGARYTSSLSPKSNLRQHLESWRGRTFTDEELQGFDLYHLLGVPCMLSVTHTNKDGNIYANIASIMGLPKGVPAPNLEGVILRYDPDDEKADDELQALPEWMQNLIGKQDGATDVYTPHENRENPAPRNYDDFADDIPF